MTIRPIQSKHSAGPLSFLATAALVLAFGCYDPTITTCGKLVCQEGTYCTLKKDGCTATLCGNGDRDKGEICDDGNIQDGDGCSSDCKSKEGCGNGLVDKEENEECDDGPKDGKGISTPTNTNACDADCTLRYCGDGFVNPIGSDIVPPEECDDGPITGTPTPTNTVTCDSDCTSRYCGDGFVNPIGSDIVPPEECDPGHGPLDLKPINTLACDSDCTLPGCGDGFVNEALGEQCDDGDKNGTFDEVYDKYGSCTKECKLASYCGDAVINSKYEACDVGQVETPTCNMSQQAIDTFGRRASATDCQVSRCGDNYVNRTNNKESCDVENMTETAECNFSANAAMGLPLPTDCQLNKCGDEYINKVAGEVCDNGALNDGETLQYGNPAGCTAKCQTQAYCGDGILDSQFGEECDHGSAKNPTDVEVYGTDHNVSDAAAYGHQDACTTSCKRARFCGDQHADTDFGEECDGGDTCGADCKGETCGNGKLDLGEDCDDGNTDDTDHCVISGKKRQDCKWNRCGDGKVHVHKDGEPAPPDDKAEECDDGGVDTERCNAICTLNVCGDGYRNKTTESCDDGKNGSLTCNGNIGAADKRCQFTECGDGFVNRNTNPKTNKPLEVCDPGLDGVGACDADCTLRSCGDGFVNKEPYTNAQGEVFDAEECDEGKPDNPQPLDTQWCTATCKHSSCGDGIVNPTTEQCDPNAAQPAGQVCTELCRISGCGDGFVNAAVGEECDPYSDFGETHGCTRSCKISECGDWYVNTSTKSKNGEKKGEICDDGNIVGGDGCSNDCHDIEDGWTCPNPNDGKLPCRPICGDGKKRGNEQCDGGRLKSDGTSETPDGPGINTAGCDKDCTDPKCGDGIVNALAGEACDGGALNPDGTSVTLDGPGVNTAGCDSDCTLPVCGDSILNGLAGETCDTGSPPNHDDADGCDDECHVVQPPG